MNHRMLKSLSPVFLLAPIFAAIFFFFRIDREHLWLDEAYSAAMAAHGFGEIVRIVEKDVHPPLYYLALRASCALFGTGETGLRALSALFAVGLVLLGVGPVRRIFGHTTAVIFSVLVISSPGVLCFAQEARMYTMAAFFVIAASLYGIEAVRHGQRADFVRYGIAAAAAAYTHYFATAAATASVLLLFLYASIRSRNRLMPLAVTAALAAASYLPWIPSFLAQVHRVKAGFWIPETNWFLVKFSLMAPYAYKYEDIMYPWTSVFAMFLSAAAVGFYFVVYRRRSEQLLPFALFALVYLLTLAAGILLSKTIAPILMPRYLICCVGLFLVCVAGGIAALPRPSMRVGASAMIVALLLPADWVIETKTFHGPFREVEARIAQSGNPDEAIVHEDVQTLFPMQWGLPKYTHVYLADDPEVSNLAGGVYPEDNLAVVAGIDNMLKRGRPFSLVDFALLDRIAIERLTPPSGWRVRDLGRFAPPFSFTQITLTRWEPTDAPETL